MLMLLTGSETALANEAHKSNTFFQNSQILRACWMGNKRRRIAL